VQYYNNIWKSNCALSRKKTWHGLQWHNALYLNNFAWAWAHAVFPLRSVWTLSLYSSIRRFTSPHSCSEPFKLATIVKFCETFICNCSSLWVDCKVINSKKGFHSKLVDWGKNVFRTGCLSILGVLVFTICLLFTRLYFTLGTFTFALCSVWSKFSRCLWKVVGQCNKVLHICWSKCMDPVGQEYTNFPRI